MKNVLFVLPRHAFGDFWRFTLLNFYFPNGPEVRHGDMRSKIDRWSEVKFVQEI